MAKQDLIEQRRRATETLLAIASIERQGTRLTSEWFADLGIEGVTPAQANALVVIFEAREPITARHVAERLSLTEVTVGRFVHALEQGGWIERKRSKADRRAFLLHPTQKAFDTLPRFIEVANRIIDVALEGMSQKDVEAFFRTVGQVNRNLSAAGGADDAED